MNEAYKNKKAFLYKEGRLTEEKVNVPVEMPAQFIINGREVLKIMVTPVKLREFAIGFLAGQGLIKDLSDIKVEVVGQKKAILYFELKEDILPANLSTTAYLNPGCGGGISFKQLDLPKVGSDHKLKAEAINQLMTDMLKSAEYYKEAGGFHSAGLAVGEKLAYFAEDIGRHNAVDKVIGSGLLDNVDFSKAAILSTGRLTVEAVSKASRMGVPMLISRSAPTNLAVSLAVKQGVTIVGYARAGSFKVYANKDRLNL